MARVMYFDSLMGCKKTCLTVKGDRVNLGTLGPFSVGVNRNYHPQKDIPIFLRGTGKDNNVLTGSSEGDVSMLKVSDCKMDYPCPEY